jgi:hypothetical protein
MVLHIQGKHSCGMDTRSQCTLLGIHMQGCRAGCDYAMSRLSVGLKFAYTCGTAARNDSHFCTVSAGVCDECLSVGACCILMPLVTMSAGQQQQHAPLGNLARLASVFVVLIKAGTCKTLVTAERCW